MLECEMCESKHVRFHFNMVHSAIGGHYALMTRTHCNSDSCSSSCETLCRLVPLPAVLLSSDEPCIVYSTGVHCYILWSNSLYMASPHYINMDRQLHPLQNMGWNYLSIPKLQRLYRESGVGQRLYILCHYLSGMDCSNLFLHWRFACDHHTIDFQYHAHVAKFHDLADKSSPISIKITIGLMDEGI